MVICQSPFLLFVNANKKKKFVNGNLTLLIRTKLKYVKQGNESFKKKYFFNWHWKIWVMWQASNAKVESSGDCQLRKRTAPMPRQVQHITLVRSSIHYTHGYIKSLWPVMVRVCNVEQILWVVYIKWIPEWTLAFITPDTDSTHHRNSWRPIFQGQD